MVTPIQPAQLPTLQNPQIVWIHAALMVLAVMAVACATQASRVLRAMYLHASETVDQWVHTFYSSIFIFNCLTCVPSFSLVQPSRGTCRNGACLCSMGIMGSNCEVAIVTNGFYNYET
jgi:hypothetical protein